MTHRQKIKVTMLKGLLEADGTPLPDSSLLEVGRTTFPTPTMAETITARGELENEGFITGASDGITGTSWALTAKGQLKAQQL